MSVSGRRQAWADDVPLRCVSKIALPLQVGVAGGGWGDRTSNPKETKYMT